MKLKNLLHLSWIAVLTFGWVQWSEGKDANMTPEQLGLNYQKASTSEEKLQVCIKAVDLGFISRGQKVEKVSEIFGKDFNLDVNRNPDGSGYGLLDFIPTKSSGDDSRGAAHEGWYLYVEYNKDRVIQNYYLTNVHK